MKYDVDKCIKQLQRSLDRLNTSPNFPGSDNWKKLLIWDFEAKLEEELHIKIIIEREKEEDRAFLND